VVDTLSKMITKAKSQGYIKGLGSFAGNSPINLNFADDTLIFLVADTKIIDAFKMLLIGFENLSGLKINYTKSELVPLNLTQIEGLQLANIIGCKIVTLPITYLGVPLHWHKLRLKDWDFLINKVHLKLEHWKGKLLSIGGRLTLIKAVLSALPIYRVRSNYNSKKARGNNYSTMFEKERFFRKMDSVDKQIGHTRLLTSGFKFDSGKKVNFKKRSSSGDPILLYLFIIAMDFLPTWIKEAQ
jgi:hypothetical protein